MIQEIYYDDYEIGHRRETLGRTITETDFVVHAGHTGDYFPHHMDAQWCKTQPFKQRIAHGTLTFSVGIGMTATLINPVAMTYGYERLRFPNPVHIGDTIRVEIEITEKRDHPKREQYGFVTERVTVRKQDDSVVLVCDHILLANKKS